MNCNNYVDVEFSTYIIVKNWMDVNVPDINDVNLLIAVNSDNLRLYKEQVPYGSEIEVDDPCDPTKKITVNNVMLNTAKIDGYLGFYVAAEVLTSSPNVSIDEASKRNPIELGNFVSGGGVCKVDNEELAILAPDEDLPAGITITIMDTNLVDGGYNDNYDHAYTVSGKFRVSLA